MDFDWDFSNVEHIARHKVKPEEAEEVLADPAVMIVAAHRGPQGQPRFGSLGATEAGRVLVIFSELRGEQIRVVTARPATAEELSRYDNEE